MRSFAAIAAARRWRSDVAFSTWHPPRGDAALGRVDVRTRFRGPDYLWHAVVTVARPGEAFELRLTDADQDWNNTIVGFDFSALGAGTLVRFHHRGWPEPNEHYRISCHCWALYLRILRRHLEAGEVVPYDRRLDV